jgi:hypothetical protein
MLTKAMELFTLATLVVSLEDEEAKPHFPLKCKMKRTIIATNKIA